MSTEDRRRFPLWVPIAAAAAGAVVAFGAVAVLDLDRDEYVTVIPASQPAVAAQDQPASAAAATDASDRSMFADVSGAQDPTPAASGDAIDREQAGAIAASHVGGVVDSIHTENDYGAAWDVDVYAPDGEYTIYVSATGEIMRVMGPYDWD
jgi:uncharacterized membrane protein YkoI